jgi:hypothetical protein
MPLVQTDNGSKGVVILQTAVALTLKLFRNDYTPVKGSVAGDFTEANFSGYSGGVALGGWSAPAIVGGRAVSTANTVTQTHNGGATSNNIYGYYVVDAGGVVWWAERDPNGPILMSVNGQQYQVIPKWSAVSEF